MKNIRRFLALVLVLALLAALPVRAKEPVRVLTDRDYVLADGIFDRLESMESVQSVTGTNRIDRIYEALCTMPEVKPGSVAYQGTDRVVWTTVDGIGCVYAAKYEALAENCTPMDEEPMELPEPVTGTHGKDVYLIEPYYGIDNSFTGQYQREAMDIAKATGGHYFLRATNRATIDAVAGALCSGGLVIFDSHGNTDYESGADVTSGATDSYLCLSTKEGITAQDYEDRHVNYTKKGGVVFCEVDGVAIANHMQTDAQNTMIWAAICLGMATDGLCRPLQERGVAVMYGYSQSVSFVGDYCFEGAFFQSLKAGKDVSHSIADMKAKYGYWDYSPQIAASASGVRGYSTIEDARRARCAFPIVSSREDVYPGHGNVDDLQEVNCTWRLVEPDCLHGRTEVRGAVPATCEEPGWSGETWCLSCGEKLRDGETIPALGHDWEGSACTRCGKWKEVPFTDVKGTDYFYDAVLWAVNRGITSGTSETAFSPDMVCTRSQVVTFLWRAAGQPEPKTTVNPFTDVRETDYFYKAVLWAVEENITSGVGGGRFGALEPCTRSQTVTFLWRAAGSPKPQSSENPFSDVSRTDYFCDAVLWAAEQGITAGNGSGFAPLAPCTRSQVVSFLYRAFA